MKNIILFIFVFLAGECAFAQSWTELNKQGIALYNQGDYQSAASIHEKALKLAQKENGKNSMEYTTSLNNLGMMYRMLGKYDAAEKCFVEDLPLRAKLDGKTSVQYLITLNNLAVIYKLTARYESAENYYLEALDIAGKLHGDGEPEYTIYLNNLASLYKTMGRYQESEDYYIKARNILAKNLKTSKKDYATCTGNLAILYRTIGDFAKAGPLYEEALSLKKELSGENNPDYAVILNNIAIYYEQIGEFKKAEDCYVQAKDILERWLGKDNPDYATFIGNLGSFYMDMENYDKAEVYILEGAQIQKNILGEFHPDYGVSLNAMGSLYHSIGDFKKAEIYFLQTLEIRKKFYGEVSTYCALTYNNLAMLYFDMDDFEKAEEAYLKSMDINKTLFGEESADYGTVINNLGIFYKTIGEFKKAENLLSEAAKIDKKIYGENSVEYAMMLTNLSSLYSDLNNFEKAETLSMESIRIYESALGPNHPKMKACINNLVDLYMAFGKYDKAYTYLKPSIGIYKSSISDASSFLSASELHTYINENTDELNVYQSLEWKSGATHPQFTSILSDFRLYMDGLQMRTSSSLKKKIFWSGDTSLISIYTKWTNYRSQITNQLSLPVTERNKDLEEWISTANDLEKTLIRNSQDFNDERRYMNVNTHDIVSTLQPGEAAVEFISFHFYTGKFWTDSILYAAVVFLPGDTLPKYVSLFEEKQLSGLLSGDSLRTFANLLYTDAQVRNVNNEISYGDSLYKLIWKPLESKLQNIKTVYYSPSGLLHNLCIDAIPNGKQLLSDQYSLQRLTSITELLNNKRQTFIPNSVALFGGIQYDIDVADLKKRSVNIDINTRSIPDDATRGGIWSYLIETKKEVESISGILSVSSIKNTIYSEQLGTEEAVKELNETSSPSIIHFSTHGYFFPDPTINLNAKNTENVFSDNSEPLLRSGLILSGANYVWQGNKPLPGVEDGILTALEVSDLYFPNTKLVVMSACETGKGDIKTSEGVYGLQRAFKIAGVEYMIVSLWQVLDKETSDFMILFYENLLSMQSIPDAFKSTQDFMKKKYRDEPYKWAGFILIK